VWLTVLLLWIVVYPLALVFLQSVRGEAGWTLQYVAEFVSERREWSAMWASIWISAASVALAAIIGIPLAFVFERVDFPGRRVLGALVALPAVLPPLVGVIAFLFLYGESGFVGRAVALVLGLDEAPWRLRGPGAILLVHAYSMYVYFYLFMRAGLARIDGSMYEAAQSLGAGPWSTVARVTLPLLRPQVAAAALLTFMTSLGSFSAPYIFGGGFRVMTTQIVASKLNGDMAPARALTRPLVRWGATGVGWVLGLFLLLPHMTLVLVSFVPVGTWTTQLFPPAYGLGNYVDLVSEPERLRPLMNSLWMAAAATVAALAISVWAGRLVVQRRASLRGMIETLVNVPWAVPGTVLAIALAATFSIRAPWVGRWVLVGTVVILPLAYLIRNIPIASGSVLAGFRQLDPSLEEAAASLGAGRWRTLRAITLPLLRPAILAGGALAFATALGDFVTSIVLYTFDTRPISIEILGALRQFDVGLAAAYGVLLMVFSAAAMTVGTKR
jgi:iron(III) transport system permease protein